VLDAHKNKRCVKNARDAPHAKPTSLAHYAVIHRGLVMEAWNHRTESFSSNQADFLFGRLWLMVEAAMALAMNPGWSSAASFHHSGVTE